MEPRVIVAFVGVYGQLDLRGDEQLYMVAEQGLPSARWPTRGSLWNPKLQGAIVASINDSSHGEVGKLVAPSLLMTLLWIPSVVP